MRWGIGSGVVVQLTMKYVGRWACLSSAIAAETARRFLFPRLKSEAINFRQEYSNNEWAFGPEPEMV